jgi:hypothetical protein
LHSAEFEYADTSKDIQLFDVAVQAAEDAGIIAAYEEDFVAPKAGVGFDGICQHLNRGDQDVEGIFEQGNGWVHFDFHDGKIVGSEVMMLSRAWSECDEKEGGKPRGVKEVENNYRLSPNSM